jgi:hypothetical protein
MVLVIEFSLFSCLFNCGGLGLSCFLCLRIHKAIQGGLMPTFAVVSVVHLQSSIPRRLTSDRRPVVQIITESLSQHDEKLVVLTSLGGIRLN